MKSLLAAIFIFAFSEPLFAQSWLAIAPMKFARGESEAVQLHDGTILVVGGYGAGTVQKSCEIYDPKTDTWKQTGSLTTQRFRFSLNILPSGKVVALGGLTDLGIGTTNSCEVYDPSTGTWSTFGTLPEASENFPTCYLEDSTLIYLGGLDANNTSFLNISGEINPNTLNFSPFPPMLIGTYSHFGQYLSARRVIVSGGGDLGGTGGPYLRSTEVYDLDKHQWRFVDSLNEQCVDGNHHIVQLADEKLVIPSGRSGPNTTTLRVQVFDPATMQWSTPGYLLHPHFHCYSFLVGADSILTIGGISDPAGGTNIVANTDWYNALDSTSWIGPPLLEPLHVYSAVNLKIPTDPCTHSEEIYVFGGTTTGNTQVNRCEKLILGSKPNPSSITLSPQLISTLNLGCGSSDTSITISLSGCAPISLDSIAAIDSSFQVI